MGITVSMIVKNEEKVLEKCLESVKDADNIVIIDTGSTDNTIEIARRYTNNIYYGDEYLWKKDFAFHRNQSLSKCPLNDWILIIDADEVLEENGIKKIREYIKTIPKGKKGVVFNTISTIHTDTMNRNIRLFLNDGVTKWHGVAHNYLDIIDEFKIDSDFTIYYGYSPAHQLDPDRTLNILKDYCDKNPYAERERYYLAREYYHKKDCDNALKNFDIYIQKSNNLPEVADAYMLSAYCFFNLGMFEDARECCIKAIIINADFKEPFILLSKISGSPKNNKKWLEFSEICTNEDVLFIRTAKFIPKDKIERDSSYYDSIYSKGYSTERYEEIYKKISDYDSEIDCSVMDIGCGTGDLASYIYQYIGFDFSEEAIKIAKNKHENIEHDNCDFFVGDAYNKDIYNEHNYMNVWTAIEVLEHLDDLKIIDNIPSGKIFIFTVPSFDDPAHLRTYTEEIVRERYKDLLDIIEIHRFNWCDGKWKLGTDNTKEFILLVYSRKK